jgi:membrane protease YdiL (CAAX protease family)
MKPSISAQSILLVCTLCLVAQHYLITNGWVQHLAVGSVHEVIAYFSVVAGNWVFDRPEWVANVAWALSSILLLGLFPALLIRLVCGHSLSNFGVRAPSNLPRKELLGFGIVIVLAVYLVHDLEGFQAVYPFFKTTDLYPDWVLFEVLYCVQFVALEFFFRGALLHGLVSSMGRAAIWVTTLPYVMVHFQKPWPEALGALVAGVVLAELSLRTRSIWPGTVLHLLAALTMDILSLGLVL